jgi:GH24 family phage-related lysozyme (muramidase)
MRPVPQIGIDFIKGAEACRLTAYLDSTGHWTIGYGHTGPEVVRGMTITPWLRRWPTSSPTP